MGNSPWPPLAQTKTVQHVRCPPSRVAENPQQNRGDYKEGLTRLTAHPGQSAAAFCVATVPISRAWSNRRRERRSYARSLRCCLLPSIFPAAEREQRRKKKTEKAIVILRKALSPARMPFLGKDWRSPGWRWTKTEHGWKRIIFYGHDMDDIHREIEFTCDDKENLFVENICELARVKMRKDFYNHNTKSQFVFRDKWIYVQKGSTKERHGYCTLGEALNRLDFSSAIHDLRRFNYVAKLFQLIARSQLTSLSGAAQKNYFNILEKIVRKVVEDHYNPRLVKELLQDLSATLHSLTLHVGRCVLVGNVNVWLCRLENILKWQQQLNDLQIPKQMCSGMSFSDLPLYMQNKILYNLSDACDIINLGQATPTLHVLSENRTLWKRLCHFHFSDKQHSSRNLVLPKSDSVDWKLMYFTLQKRYPMKEQYGDTLHFCKHCSILFWKDRHLALLFKDCGHPCTANDPERCLVPISPQHFIDLFQF